MTERNDVLSESLFVTKSLVERLKFHENWLEILTQKSPQEYFSYND